MTKIRDFGFAAYLLNHSVLKYDLKENYVIFYGIENNSDEFKNYYLNYKKNIKPIIEDYRKIVKSLILTKN